ncbi:MAG: TatD family hydrolase [Planctomycetota bacterium]|jgi:TatD DNase family protein
MNLIDTHAHLTFEQLAKNVDEVLLRSKEASVTSWITVGTDPEQNEKVVELAEKYDNLYAAVGIHPHEAKDVTTDTMIHLIKLAEHPKVVAIGETGLDYHYDHSPRESQKSVFTNHLQIAAELKLPVIIHSREAFDDTIEIVDKFSSQIEKIVFHCFTGTPDQAKIIINKGFYISFTGAVTFKNSKNIRESAKLAPLEKMMIETDCPYMSPEPMRKQRINEPALLVHTAKFLAELKNIHPEEFADVTTAAAQQFFAIP